MGKWTRAKRYPNHRWIGWGAPYRGWTKSCSAGIWAFCFLRHRSRCRPGLRTERDRPRVRIWVSAACDESRGTGRPGCCAGAQAGSGRRLDGGLCSGRGASRMSLRSFLIEESIVTKTDQRQTAGQTELSRAYDVSWTGQRGGRRGEGERAKRRGGKNEGREGRSGTEI